MNIRNGLDERTEEASQFFHALTSSEEERIVCRGMDLSFERSNLTLFRIDEITFEDEAPRHEALENVLASIRVPGINFVYLILGDRNGVEFYFGLSRDLYAPESTMIEIAELGESLKASLLGNFRGSHVTESDGNTLKRIMDRLKNSHDAAFLCGVPGVNKEEEKQSFQGVDRLANVMQGREFGLMILAKPIDDAECRTIEQTLYDIYRKLNYWNKISIQTGTNEGTSKSIGKSHSVSQSTTDTTADSTTKSSNTSNGTSETTSQTTNNSDSTTTNTTNSTTRGESNGLTITQGDNSSQSDATATNRSTNTTNTTTKNSGSSSNSNSSSSAVSGQEGSSSTTTKTNGTSNSNSKQHTESSSESDSKATTDAKTKSTSTATSKATSSSANESNGTSTSKSKSVAQTTSETTNDGENVSTGSSLSNSLGDIDKEACEWMKYLDEVIFPRLDYGKGKGLFMVSIYLLASNPKDLMLLENNTKSIFAGESGNRVPLERLHVNETRRSALQSFQQPFGDMPDESRDMQDACYIRSHCCLPVKEVVGNKVTVTQRMFLGNWMSAKELAVLSGIPQKEVTGLRLREEVEFGLNIPSEVKPNDRLIPLGRLVQSGVTSSIPVSILESELDRHIFIAGVTGSGKTTTSKKILLDSGLPFLVIEPAKTEYRSLKETACDDLIVFTLGNDEVAPFRLNPFEFFKGESITGRVDMIKASIEAAFDMEAAIPQIIEKAIYQSYEDKGWDVTTNENSLWDDPYADGVYAFPRLEDVIRKTHTVVNEQGFDERLKNDYIGSINARLQGLMIGAKGQMLNCRRSLDFKELLDKRVVIELEGIRSGNEKSLIMGFILTNFMEAIRRRYEASHHEPHHHILLVEEAHRLLSRFSAGDSPNRKHGVETFADMLAEIRKYGESLIIADQIPNKLTPEVLKNTNTKIVQRLFAKDDKDTIGSTMSLTEEQCDYLSSLRIGNAIMFSGNWPKAVQVAITYDKRTKEVQVDEQKLSQTAFELYAKQYRRGIFDYAELLETEPDVETMKELMRLPGKLYMEFKKIVSLKANGRNDVETLAIVCEKFGAAKILMPLCVRHWGEEKSKMKCDLMIRIMACLGNNEPMDTFLTCSLNE